MPELPEVETIRGHLAPHVEGRTLEAVEVLDPRWSRPLAPSELTAAVQGRVVEKLARRGKYLVWELGDHELAFADPRRFGTGELALGPEARAAFFDARLGVEPLERDFTGDHLYALARTSRAPIKAFLLDQRRVAGVGNIYADEALFRARVHPLRPANKLTRAQCTAIRDGVVESLLLGLEHKGATIDDFRDPYGVSGTFQDRFLVHTREHEPCPNCGRAIRKLRVAGRGTYVCEHCQARPRQRRKRS